MTVIGAGVGGLAVAIALAQRGAQVRVLEQAPAITEVGAGLQISPNGACVLDALGLGPALAAAGLPSRAVVLRDHRRGAQVLRMDLAGRGPFWLVHRADLIAALAQGARAAGVQIVTGARVAAVGWQGGAQAEAGQAVLTHADGRAEPLPGLLIGADGLHSVLRRAILGSDPPRFSGQVAWRATLPCPAGIAPEAQVFMGPGRHLVAYPLRGGRLLNLVGVEERAAWTPEGWTHPGDPAEFARVFAGFGGPVPGWLAAVSQVMVWGLFRHPVAPVWARGQAVLLGDAAHPTLPFLAQGACMALEDGWTLAAALDRAPDTALARYADLRAPRCRRIVAAATANARRYHLRGPARLLAHGALRAIGAVAPGLVTDRFDWLYAHDVTARLP